MLVVFKDQSVIVLSSGLFKELQANNFKDLAGDVEKFELIEWNDEVKERLQAKMKELGNYSNIYPLYRSDFLGDGERNSFQMPNGETVYN